MSYSVLLCTVGGSHQPVLKAIEATQPIHVCFFCSDSDPVTGKSGSISQVTGSGKVIKADPRDKKPTLPSIPTLAGLGADTFETVTVSADDLDQAFFAMRDAILNLAVRFPEAHLVADYTGGTKTMTAALVCAAMESDRVELQLVAGARPDLDRVSDGTEQAVTASVARFRLDRAMAPHLAAWSRFAYREAADGLDRLRVAVNAPDRPRLELARTLSRALAHWDDFNHADALALVQPYAGHVAGSYPQMFPALRLLVGSDKHRASDKRDAVRLFDLWLNAERRAAQGRFDDAVARAYRLIEWTAQWQLRTGLRIDTADFPADKLPEGSRTRPGRDGKIKIGLYEAWQVIGELGEHGDGQVRFDAQVRQFATQRAKELLDQLQVRNNSILAHGFRPVREADWNKMRSWMEERFLPVLRAAASKAGVKEMPPQLPTEPPEIVRMIGGSDEGKVGRLADSAPTAHAEA